MEIPYKFTAEQIVQEGRTTKENIETIRNWLWDLDDKNGPSKIQDELIVLFLLSCKNDIGLTKHTVITYYQCKKNGPEIHDDKNMERPDVQLALNTIHLSDIPVRTDDNYAVHYFKVSDPDSSNFELIPAMKISYMLVDVTLEKNPPNGVITIIDMKGIHMHPPGLEQDQLFEIVPKKCLPKEYGGDLPSESELHERTLKQFEDMQTFWYIEESVRKQCI